MCRSRRELSNAYFLAKCGFDTAENEPCKVFSLSVYRSPRCVSELRPIEITESAIYSVNDFQFQFIFSTRLFVSMEAKFNMMLTILVCINCCSFWWGAPGIAVSSGRQAGQIIEGSFSAVSKQASKQVRSVVFRNRFSKSIFDASKHSF